MVVKTKVVLYFSFHINFYPTNCYPKLFQCVIMSLFSDIYCLFNQNDEGAQVALLREELKKKEMVRTSITISYNQSCQFNFLQFLAISAAGKGSKVFIRGTGD